MRICVVPLVEDEEYSVKGYLDAYTKSSVVECRGEHMSSPLSIEPDEGIVLDEEDANCIDGKMPRDKADGAADKELAVLDTDVVPTDKTSIAYVSDVCEHALECSTVENLGISVELSQATPMPFTEVASLGSAFSSLVTQVVSSETYLRAVDDNNNPISVRALTPASNGLGYRSTVQGEDGKYIQQATLQNVSTVIDPSTALMALSLMAMNQKIDDVQKSIDKLAYNFELEKQATIRSALTELENDARDYAYNSGDDLFRQKALNAARRTRELAGSCIIVLDEKTANEIDEIRSSHHFHTSRETQEHAGNLVSLLGQYQLALQTHNLACFIEVVAQQNFDSRYLVLVRERLAERDNAYRKLYGQCCDALEGFTDKQVGACLTDASAGAAKGLGGLLAKTPVEKRIGVGETLEEAGEAWQRKSKAKRMDLLEDKLSIVRPGGIDSYVRSLDELEAAHGSPMAVLAYDNALYLVPARKNDNVELDAGPDKTGGIRRLMRRWVQRVCSALRRLFARIQELVHD